MDLLIPNKEEGITIRATTVDQVNNAPQRCIAWWPFCEAHLQDVRLLHRHRVDIMWLPLLLSLKHTWAWSMRVRVSIWQNSNTWTWKMLVNLPSIKSTEERSKFCSVRLLNKSTEVSKKWRAFHISCTSLSWGPSGSLSLGSTSHLYILIVSHLVYLYTSWNLK